MPGCRHTDTGRAGGQYEKRGFVTLRPVELILDHPERYRGLDLLQ